MTYDINQTRIALTLLDFAAEFSEGFSDGRTAELLRERGLEIWRAATGRDLEGGPEINADLSLPPENIPHATSQIKWLWGHMLENHDCKTAAILAGRLLEIDPWQAEHHARLGSALMRGGLNEEARKSFDKAMEIDPNDVWTLVEHGLFLWVQGDLKGARESYIRADEYAPMEFSILRDMVQLELAICNTVKVEKLVEQMAQARHLEEEENLTQMLALARHYKKREGNTYAAGTVLKALHKTLPENRQISNNLGLLNHEKARRAGSEEEKAKLFTLAEEFYAKAIKADPEGSAVPYFNMGKLYVDRKDDISAMKYFLKAKDLDFFDAATHRQLAQIFYRADKMELALEYSKNALLFAEKIEGNMLRGAADIASKAKEQGDRVSGSPEIEGRRVDHYPAFERFSFSPN